MRTGFRICGSAAQSAHVRPSPIPWHWRFRSTPLEFDHPHHGVWSVCVGCWRFLHEEGNLTIPGLCVLVCHPARLSMTFTPRGWWWWGGQGGRSMNELTFSFCKGLLYIFAHWLAQPQRLQLVRVFSFYYAIPQQTHTHTHMHSCITRTLTHTHTHARTHAHNGSSSKCDRPPK